ncbi:hypothetical protein [Nocardioides sp. HB32]
MVIALIAATVTLSGCGGASADQAHTNSCESVKEQTHVAAQKAQDSIDAYNEFTEGAGFGAGTSEGQNLGETARQDVLTALHLIVNSPECFSKTEVAQAQSRLSGWQQPGARPSMTAAPDTCSGWDCAEQWAYRN